MSELELLRQLRQTLKSLDEFQQRKITKVYTDWTPEILDAQKELAEKYFQTQTSGSECSCCGGTGRN